MTIHIAGFPVRVGNHKRQLCAWCGYRLVDVNLANCFSEDGSEPAHWEPNELVRVEHVGPLGSVTSSVQYEDGAPIPAGWCGDDDRPRLRVVPKESEETDDA